MAIVAVLPGHNLFSSPPPNPRINESLPSTSKPPSPPIPIPKYPKTQKSQKSLKSSQQYDKPPDKSPNPAFKAVHRRTKYYKPVTDGVIASEEGRSVVIGESGVSYLLPGAPFEFQFSYSETPKVKPLAIREPAFLPFAPPTMPRPWTGKSPLKQSKKKIPLLESFNPPSPETKGLKRLEMPRPFSLAKFPNGGKTREEVLGKPLTKSEIRMLVKPHLAHNRQVNVGRDGLTHNMLELIHSHWRQESVCKVRCRGVPTVDMNNVCHHLEEKTGGKIIHQVGGFVYLFRGRNYDYKTRPRYPTMLWKPAAPVYPKLIQEVPEGLTKVEADDLRVKGKNLLPICKLAKNGVYINLVKDVRDAFEESPLAKIDCRGMHASDYKKVGAKLKELVPGVLLSFDEAQILMWRGKDWKLMYPETRSLVSDYHSSDKKIASSLHGSGESDDGSCQPVLKDVNNRMISLWKHAIESSKALPLEAIDLGPDDLLEKVELFERMSQATEHSYPALVLSNEDDHSSSEMEHNDGTQHEAVKDEDIYEDGDDEECVNDPFGEVDFPLRVGSLPVDLIAKRLQRE